MRSTTLKLLVDTSVSSNGIFAHGISVEVPGWGNRLALYEIRRAEDARGRWLQEQAECLPTISRLAVEGVITLCTSDELRNEAWKRPGSFPAPLFGDIFKPVRMDEVPPALRRSLFFQVPMDEYLHRDGLRAFSKWLLSIDPAKFLSLHADWLTDFEKYAVGRLGRLHALCDPVSEKLYGDAFHLWTAETNNLDGFLTMDRTFAEKIGPHASPSCRPIYPDALLQTLNVTQRDRLPFSYGKRYYINGIPYD